MKNVGNSSRGRIVRSPENFQGMYRAHCAVIFAIAQLSCYTKVDIQEAQLLLGDRATRKHAKDS